MAYTNQLITNSWKTRFSLLLILFIVSFLLYFASTPEANRNPLSFYYLPIIGRKSSCSLPYYDVWNNDMSDFINPKYDPFPDCDRKFKPMTELKNGKWRKVINDTGISCRVRCHEKSSVNSNKIGSWILEEGSVNCEFLEASCSKNGHEIYGYVHSQIIPINVSAPGSDKTSTKPNVIVILLDSLGYGDAKRSLKNTTSYMINNFQSVEFPFVNKVGENSRPNAVSLWFGKSLFDIDNSLFGGKFWKADLPDNVYCGSYLDDYSHFYKDFRENGYKTMNGDDYGSPVLVFPNCRGFKVDPFGHNMRPFQLSYARGSGKVNQHLKGHLCREVFHPIVEYTEQFINAYPDDPKFAWIWLSYVGHDHESSFFRVDNYFEEFMRRNKEVLDKSFVILMGDHGQRIGVSEMFETKTSQLEISNPYLSISVPKKYRNTGILEKMRESSKKLQTHFDTRATILDIVRYQPATNFTSTEFLNMTNEKGHSYFRTQPDFDRNCGTLPIPPEFCICKSGSSQVKDDALVRLFGSKISDRVNEEINNKGHDAMCVKMELEEVTSVEKYDTVGEIDAYLVYVRMKQPSGATYRVLIQHQSKTDEFTIQSIIRTNSYWKSANCIQDEVARPFCYCKGYSTTFPKKLS